MKKKDILKQISDKPDKDLNKDLYDYRDKLWNLKKDLVAGKVKNVREIKELKKTIARILTLLRKTTISL